jgi:hypothetical protein
VSALAMNWNISYKIFYQDQPSPATTSFILGPTAIKLFSLLTQKENKLECLITDKKI